MTSVRMSLVCQLAVVLVAEIPVAASATILSNHDISITLGSSAGGLTASNSDRVDAIQWKGTNGTFSNYVANGGPVHCNDPQESFGQAYGDGGDARPFAIIAGTLSSFSGVSKLGETTHVTSLTSCDNTLNALTTTAYALSNHGGFRNALKIVRSFKFRTALVSSDLRAYVPRLPVSLYPFVLAPDKNGIVQTYNAGQCSGGCALTDWNGTWFADDDGHGNGIVVLRSPSKNRAALVVIDNDSFSGSNNTAVTLSAPAGGWFGTYKETEYLCFYDSGTWTAAQRSAGRLPAGCTGVSIK